MLEFIKKYKKTLAVLGVAVLGISQTEIPSGGMNILNSAGTAVIEFFDTGDAEFSGDVTANAFIGDGSGLTGVSGGTGHTIKEEGTGLTTRANLNFVGPTVTASDNAGTSSTDVTINAVAGPSSATDNTVPRFDSTTGKLLQGSGVTLDDSNNLGGIGALTANNLDLTSMLAVVEGGTGAATFTDAGVLIGNGSGVVQSTSAGTTGQVLTSNGVGVDPTFQSFPGGGDALTTNTLAQFAATTSGELSTLLTNETGSGLAVFGTSPTLVTPNLGTPSALTLTNATGLPVIGGGTGASTLADAGVMIGNGTGAVQVTGPGTAGQVLTSNGTGVDPTFQDATGGGSGDLVGPASATDNAIARYDGTTGKLVQNSAVTIADTTGNITTSGTVDGRDLSTDGTKLDGIETGATADQTNSEIETAYNAQVAAVTQAEAEAGTSTTVKRWTPERVKQAIDALAPSGSGGDPTYGSDAGAADDSVYVDATGDLGLGTTTPTEEIDIYRTDSAPRIKMRYYNTSGGDVTAYPGTATYTTPGTNSWTNAYLVEADDSTSAMALDIGGSPDFSQNLKTINYGFAIPSGATISGVKVEVEGRTTGSALEYGAYLVRGGTIATGVNRSTGGSWTTTDAVYTFGSSVDDWGGITPAEVNDTGFGFAYRVEFPSSGTCYIDFIRITIYYSDVSGDYIWTSGPDILDGAYTVRASATDQLRIAYLSGDAEFSGTVTAPAFIGDGSLLTNIAGGDVDGPASSTDNAIARFDSTTGKIIQNSAVTIADTSGNIATSGTVDGRDLSTDGTKLDSITSGASVSSVGITGTQGIVVDSGSPVTTSGSIQLSINGNDIFNTTISQVSTATPDTGDVLLFYDGAATKEASLTNFLLTATGNDNYLYKKNGSTGQFDLTGLLVDDSNNVSGLGTINGHTLPSGGYTLATTSQAEVLTNKDIRARELVASGSVTVDAGAYDRVVITGTSSSPVTIGAPTGTFVNGKKLEFAINQHGSSAATFNFNLVFVSGADWALGGAIPAVSTTLDAWDYYLFEWNNYESQWHLLACSQGN